MLTEHEAPDRHADALITRLVEAIGAQFAARSVFATPVEHDGVTVIPVAAVRFGLGGGMGNDPDKHQEGEGAGAGGSMTAVGYIELKDGRSRFVPIVRPERMVALVMLIGLAVLALLRPADRPTAGRRNYGRARGHSHGDRRR